MHKFKADPAQKFIEFMKRSHFVIITLFYWIVSVVIFQRYGIKYVNDSTRYIEYADTLFKGFYFDPHNFWYIGYVIFIGTIRLISLDYLAIVVVQYIVSYLAVLALYQSSYLLFQKKKCSLITSFMYIFFIELMTWNSYILTESLYASCVCFSIYLLLLSEGNKKVVYHVATFFVILLTILIKPTGIALLGSLAIVFIVWILELLKSRSIKYTVVLLAAVCFVLLVNKMLTTYKVMENYQLGEVIYDITTLPYQTQYKTLLVSPPENIYVPEEHMSPTLKIVCFIWHHPVYWLKLFFAKLFFFLSHIRPYWSLTHNLFSIFTLVPLYLLSTRTLFKAGMLPRHVLFTTTYLIIHIVSVGITSEDWDGRFIIPLLPVLFILSSWSIENILSHNRYIQKLTTFIKLQWETGDRR